MPRKPDGPGPCVCTTGHHCARPRAYGAYGFICWPCRHGSHSLAALDLILARHGDRAISRRANAAAKRQKGLDDG